MSLLSIQTISMPNASGARHELRKSVGMKSIRIANGQGFWGDWLDAPIQLVERGPIDYLTLDYLAEITMSIMQKQKLRDPKAGYARDFLYVIERVLAKCLRDNIRI